MSTDELEQAISSISLGRSMLFVGSGFSHLAKNCIGEHLPLAPILAKKLAKLIDDDEETDLDIISDIFLEMNKKDELYRILNKYCKAVDIPDFLKNIIKENWKCIYTTNYDNIIEECLPEVSKYTRNSDIRKISGSDKYVCYLNGRLSDTNEQNYLEQIHITNTQYFTNSLSDSEWAHKLRSDMIACRSVFFVGYSMYDFDIAKIAFEVGRLGKKIFFIQHEKLKESAKNKLGRFGSVHLIGIPEFNRMLLQNARTTREAEHSEFLVNFRELEFPENAHMKPEGTDIYDLVVNGNVNFQFMINNLAQKIYTYGVKRDDTEECMEHINSGEKNFLIKGDIGNGKNYFSADLLCRLNVLGYRIFNYEPISDSVEDDVSFLTKVEGRICIYFADVYSSSHHLRVVRNSCPNAIIVASSRSAVYEILRFEIENPYGQSPFSVDLDELTDNEIRQIVDYFDRAALWGTFQGLSVKKKKEIIVRDCKRTLRGIVLRLFEQPAVRVKLENFVSEKLSTHKSKIAFVKLCAISSTGFNLSFAMVRELLGVELANKLRSKSDELILEFYKVERGRHIAKSAIVSEFFIREFVDDSTKIDIYSELIFDSWKYSSENVLYKEIYKHFMRFSYIERVFGKSQKTEKLVRYYEEIRRLGVFSRNPQFWLQYAIARMSFYHYEVAGQYFNTAYGISEMWDNYDNKMINTQYARYLVERNIYGKDRNPRFDANSDIQNAIDIITELTGGDKSEHHPYRVACRTLEFCESNHRVLDDVSRQKILAFAILIQDRIKSVDKDLAKSRYVKRCASVMSDVRDFFA